MRRPYRGGTLRRFIVLSAIAFWLGGFTFYTGVVVPTGMQVLGSHLRQGLITQKVTLWINVAGACAIPVLLWNTIVIWRNAGKMLRWCLAGSLIAVALLQIELFVMHPFLDRLLDVKRRRIIDYDRFDLLHHLYLISASVQWGFGFLHALCIVALQSD